MVAVRISQDVRMAVAASPRYLGGRDVPRVPQDLTGHPCINMRLPTYDSVYAWEFQKDGQHLQVHVQGQCTFNTTPQKLQAALDGYGFACLPDDMVREHVAARRLVRVLGDWCPVFPGYHLYYPSWRQASPAFALIVDTLRI